MKAALGLGLLSFLLSSSAGAAESVEAGGFSPWSTDGALTLPKGRWELALFGTSRYGLVDDLEVALQPFVFVTLPHVEAKLKLWQRGPRIVAVRPRLSYPTPFLNLVSKEGTGGLLPATTDVPQAVQIEADAVFSWLPGERQLLSFAFGLAVAPRETSDDFPLLDFPFLYPRFAPLYTWVVPRASVSFEGRMVGSIFYLADLRGYVLPLEDVDAGYAVEQGLMAEYRFGTSVALDLGLRTSVARYPIGTRLHLLPYLDVKVGF